MENIHKKSQDGIVVKGRRACLPATWTNIEKANWFRQRRTGEGSALRL